jgi:hypothetical protein
MRVLLAMKQPIDWKNRDLNVRLQDLTQLAASVGVAKKAVRDWPETIQNTRNP